jgi:TPR repeat protein
LVRVREWLVRRAGVTGCEPAALEAAIERDALGPQGLFYFARSLITEDPERSEKLARRAGELGHSWAVKHVGTLLQRRGELDEARESYRRAIDRGDNEARVYLALTLKDEDPHQAAELFRASAERGSLPGMYNLALTLYPSDREAALSWLERYDAGRWDLSRLVDDLGPQEAYQLFRVLAERDSVGAMYCMGLMLYPSNREVAFSLLERAAAGGQRQARYVLSLPEPRRSAHLVHVSQRLLQLPRSQHGYESGPRGLESSVTQT